MKWRKLGRVWAPDGSLTWAKTHAHLPTPYQLDERRIRVFVACLDGNRFGRITFVDVAADDPAKVVYDHRQVVLDIGSIGTFDDCGVVPSCAIPFGEGVSLYYVGFQRAYRVPYMIFTGLCVADRSALSFRRVSRCPVLDRTAEEPFSRGAPFVCDRGGRLQMWYWSCTEWTASNGVVHYNNVIRSASSGDGIAWQVAPDVCVVPRGDEYAVGRPWVTRSPEGGYRMFYSVRSDTEKYKIGCATSADGIGWTRKDEDAGISRSESGWDSEMICYPALIDVDGRRFMFYNGNAHGATGFGCAELLAD